MVKPKWTWFDCPKCKGRFHIRKCASGQWRRYLPPAYCPKCGAKAPDDAKEDGK